MSASQLQGVAEQVVLRAQRQGYIVPSEVREELVTANLPETYWKDVLALARPSLAYRRGRYYYSAPVSDRVRAEQSQQQDIRSAIETLLTEHRAARSKVERRGEDRVDFIHPIQVVTDDNRTLTFLSRDLSVTGIRLIGTRRLLGQKVRVRIPVNPAASIELQVRILWTCPVGEDLVENGGAFLSLERS